MPTKLGQFLYRRFDHQSRGSRAAGPGLRPNVIWIRGPWPGWEPDLNPNQATPGAARDTLGMIDREGTLTHQNGFEKVGSAYLPLGGTSPPDVGSEEPVVCIAMGRTKSTQAVRRYAITGDSTLGHFYELVAGVWDEIPFDTNASSGPAGIVCDSSDPASTLFDSAHYSEADYTVFASGSANGLIRFPGIVATEYEYLAGLGSLTTLTANSVCRAEERLHAFGTVENGTSFPTRWRWTNKGASGAFDPTGTGAGFADLASELGGEGIAVRQLGPKMALYTTTGTLLARRTNQTTDPFAKDYVAEGRGLLSTHSVAQIAPGIHFGIFTDGWFMLRSDGTWNELGVTDKGYHKWRREFYGSLDWTNRKRVICEYDENDHWVYIAFPQTGAAGNGPSVVWVYDIINNTCWPAPDWTYKPNVFGGIVEEASTGLTWGDFTGIPWSSGTGSWGSYESTTGQRRVLHGTANGLVYVHLPSLVTQDGVLPSYRYQSHYFAGEAPEAHKKIDGLYLGYTRVQDADAADPSPVSLSYQNEDGTQAIGAIEQTKGTVNTEQVDFTNPGAVSGLQHRFVVSGTTPIKIGAVGVQITGSSGKARREESA